MIKTPKLLHLSFNIANCFLFLKTLIKSQYHADEKRNVKQPPHLLVIKNLTSRFNNLMIDSPTNL